eukprot:1461451-Rhodomonas_salina.2
MVICLGRVVTFTGRVVTFHWESGDFPEQIVDLWAECGALCAECCGGVAWASLEENLRNADKDRKGCASRLGSLWHQCFCFVSRKDASSQAIPSCEAVHLSSAAMSGAHC